MGCASSIDKRNETFTNSLSIEPQIETTINAKYHFKGILVGDSSVGKTSLFKKFIDGTFSNDISASVGVDFRVKYVKLNEDYCKIELWDTAGQERYKSLASSYYKKVDFVVFVYDCQNQQTFDNLNSWYNDVKLNAPEEVIKMVLANKSEKIKVVDPKKGEDFSKSIDALFFETSAKEQDLNTPFEELSKILIKNIK